MLNICETDREHRKISGPYGRCWLLSVYVALSRLLAILRAGMHSCGTPLSLVGCQLNIAARLFMRPPGLLLLKIVGILFMLGTSTSAQKQVVATNDSTRQLKHVVHCGLQGWMEISPKVGDAGLVRGLAQLSL